ncbi:hypothetical protein V5799_018268 [Amblyomma americanum]|uniref:Uncharacterized protein n=1 Tax=Amblyomma americanum TaxID=6943 RepID=A0AAQ4EZY7_AMBAM
MVHCCRNAVVGGSAGAFNKADDACSPVAVTGGVLLLVIWRPGNGVQTRVRRGLGLSAGAEVLFWAVHRAFARGRSLQAVNSISRCCWL